MVLLAAGCTGDGDPPQPRPTGDDENAAPGVLRFGVIGAPPTLDPYSALASDLTYALVRPVYPSLFRLLPNGTPQPYLASSIRSRVGSATVTLERASWSDGRPIRARDVVASAKRARFPSGFAGLSVDALDARTVRFEGRVSDWEERLATAAFVLPDGRAGNAFGGPFSIARHTPGYEVVLRRNDRFFGEAALLDEIRVRSVQDLDLMLLLLEEGKLDAAAPLATVNLDERLDEFGLDYDRAEGAEAMWLDFRNSTLMSTARSAFLGDIRFGEIADAFVRDEGERLVPARIGGDSGTAVTETLIGPSGDELLSLFMRASWFQLRDEGHSIELLRVDPEVLYGRWKVRSPSGIAVRRAMLPPGAPDPFGTGAQALEVFRLDSFVVWRDGVTGLQAGPTLDGPLWNAESLARG